MHFCGALAGAVVAEIVLIHAVDDVRDTARGAHFLEHSK